MKRAFLGREDGFAPSTSKDPSPGALLLSYSPQKIKNNLLKGIDVPYLLRPDTQRKNFHLNFNLKYMKTFVAGTELESVTSRS